MPRFELPNSFLFLGPTMSGKTTTFANLFSSAKNFKVMTDDERVDRPKLFRVILIAGSNATSSENKQHYKKLFATASDVILFPLSVFSQPILRQVTILFTDMKRAIKEIPHDNDGFRVLTTRLLAHLATEIEAKYDENVKSKDPAFQDVVVLDDCNLPGDAYRTPPGRKRGEGEDPFGSCTFQSFISRSIHHNRRSLVTMQQAPGGPLQNYFHQNTPYVIQQMRNTLPLIVEPILKMNGVCRSFSTKERKESLKRLQHSVRAIKSSKELMNKIPFGVWTMRGSGLSSPVLAFHYGGNPSDYFNQPNFDYFTF